MQGNIDFSGTLSGSIAGSGGGSEVTITPTIQSGTKIADYTIDETSGSLYAPDTGSDVTITPTVSSGTKIADYSIDEISGSLYAPDTGSDVTITPTVSSGTKIADYSIDEISGSLYAPTPPIVPDHIVNDLTQTYDGYPRQAIATFQKDGGTTDTLYCPDYTTEYHTNPDITTDILIGYIDNNLGRQDIYIPKQSGVVDYKVTEQDTGILWIDNRHIYQLSIVCDRQYQMTTNGYIVGQVVNELANVDCIIDIFGVMVGTIKKFVQFDSADITVVSNVNKLRVYLPKAQTFNIGDVITIKYIKTVS